MAPTPCVSQFMSFPGLSWNVEDHTCMWYLPDKRRTCLKNTNGDNKTKIKRLHMVILHSIHTEGLLEMLREFAPLCCCRHLHRIRLGDSGLLELVVQRWRQELLTREDNLYTLAPIPSDLRQHTVTRRDPDTHTYPSSNRMQTRFGSQQASLDEQTSLAGTIELSTSLFRPRKCSTTQSVASRLRACLPTTSEPGTIYLFTREASPGFVKIGYSKNGAVFRLRQWERTCGYEPKLLASFDYVPHMRRVEDLIHLQLADFWRVEKWCSRCCSQHQEWFEIGREQAIKVAKQWCDWMKIAEPYNEDKSLKSVWQDVLRRLELVGRSVTAETLLAIHSRMVNADTIFTSTQSSTVPARRSVTATSIHDERDNLAAEPAADVASTQELLTNFTSALSQLLTVIHQTMVAHETIRRLGLDRAPPMVHIPRPLQRQDTSTTVTSEA